MVFPVLQIHQKPALLGMKTERGEFSMSQPRAQMTITRTPPQWERETYSPELRIDQSKAWEAYTGGAPLTMNKRIYSGIENVFMQNLAEKVERGNRVAEFYKPGNTIAEVYGTDTNARSFPEHRGVADFDNVDVSFLIKEAKSSSQPGEIEIRSEARRPEIEYNRAKLDIYIKQYASVEITPPEINLYG